MEDSHVFLVLRLTLDQYPLCREVLKAAKESVQTLVSEDRDVGRPNLDLTQLLHSLNILQPSWALVRPVSYPSPTARP